MNLTLDERHAVKNFACAVCNMGPGLLCVSLTSGKERRPHIARQVKANVYEGVSDHTHFNGRVEKTATR